MWIACESLSNGEHVQTRQDEQVAPFTEDEGESLKNNAK
jgi:hypothetical protein